MVAVEGVKGVGVVVGVVLGFVDTLSRASSFELLGKLGALSRSCYRAERCAAPVVLRADMQICVVVRWSGHLVFSTCRIRGRAEAV